ncbi:hypothetical protein PC146_003881 [Salmonella enterica]|nr:hypothetical protein [Salmonella enterica]EBF8292245.1 hypothetical protein [Salmonella enterica subsp. enterica serovar Wagenia]EBQ9587591.1 hypothetical protein [Salmonella enterica subsp. enterica serovar Penarth]EBU8434322.1 hypothetical protein [Salmonella enterica subsp. enterica serovar Ughelli]EBV4143635.1 hypothetical protein [Salmonella enterica subsp. enterica serovar Benin]EBW9582996.1 hypothetical protein [Salmonella enterica subsp. enterica serovar Wangata]EBY6100831.1 hypoth
MSRKNRCVLEIDKELTPFLFNAIIAIKNSEWSKLYDVENFYLIFNPIIRKTENVEFYTITFLSEEITQDNWMDIGSGGIEVKEVNVNINVKTKEVISIYGGR